MATKNRTAPRQAAGSIGFAMVVALALSSAYAADQTAATSALVGGRAACTAHIANWSSFDAPGAGVTLLAGTKPIAINDSAEITGTWVDEFLVSHGFLRKRDGTLESFDPPNVSTAHGGGGTTVEGINDRGEIVGSYQDLQLIQHGFIRSADGKFTIVDDPDPTSAATSVSAINDWGVAVGAWQTALGSGQGFVRHADGSVSNIAGSFAFSNINDLGEASGQTSNGSSGLLLYRDGKRVIWAPPQATSTPFPTGLNIEGSVAGFFFDAQGVPHGFVRHANGHFTMVSPSAPAYNAVRLGSINDRGTVVGYELSPDGQQQGLAQLEDGTQVLVSAPAADQQFTSPTAINDKNVLTGTWYDPASGFVHGFVATLVSCH